MPSTLRWFAEGGTRFTRAFATTPACCPSRASIYSGRYAHNHGVHSNETPGKLDQRSTIQRYLSETGYRTALFGKFLNHWRLDRKPPYFSTTAIFAKSRLSYVDAQWSVNGSIRKTRGYSTEAIEDWAINFLRDLEDDGDESPWFLVLSPSAPHFPYQPSPRYAHARVPRWEPTPAVLERDRSDKPSFMQARRFPLRKARLIRAGQLRALMSVDDLVQNVFEELEDLGESDDLLAFFLSDNGFLWGDHGLGGESNGKGVPYMRSIRIPFLARWPERFTAGAKDSRLVANIDIAPTIAAAAGISVDRSLPMDGRNLAESSSRDHLLIEGWRSQDFHKPTWASLVSNGSQYIEYSPAAGGPVLGREFYRLDEDPWQLRNVLGNEDASDDPGVEDLSRRLSRARACRGATCP